MKKALWGGCLLFFIFVIVGVSSQRHALACEILPLLDYSRLNGHVFIGADHKPASTENIEALLQAASLRIERMYGEPHSLPRSWLPVVLRRRNVGLLMTLLPCIACHGALVLFSARKGKILMCLPMSGCMQKSSSVSASGVL